jgi:hypothetical protein
MKGGQGPPQDVADLEDRQEMNELVDSDPELYAADTEQMNLASKSSKKKEREKLKADI